MLSSGIKPFVSVVIAVFNEEKAIDRRLENILSQDYPADKMEVIVVSDGSTDATCRKVKAFADKHVRLVELQKRRGKAAAINQGVALANGEVVVFADARQRFEQDAVSRLAANFADPCIGCVSGELVFYGDAGHGSGAEMGAYWRYEKWIRKAESINGSVVGATGAIYAIRRALFTPLPEGTILDDVLVPLSITGQGYRCVFEPRAVAYDVSNDVSQEWRRKVRTLAGNWQLMGLRPGLLMPGLNSLWWRFVSHKVMRLLVPFALVVLFFSGALLPGVDYRAATDLQLIFYGAALAGLAVPALRRVRPVRLCYFFLVMNAAAAAGFWFWLTGRSGEVWKTGQGAYRGDGGPLFDER